MESAPAQKLVASSIINARKDAFKMARETLLGKYVVEEKIPSGELEALANQYFNQLTANTSVAERGLGGGAGIAGGQGIGNRPILTRRGIM